MVDLKAVYLELNEVESRAVEWEALKVATKAVS